MQQHVRAKVISNVDFRKQIAIEITCSHRQSPARAIVALKYVLLFAELYLWRVTAAGAFPQEKMFAAAVVSARHRILHLCREGGVGVENVRAVGEKVAKDQIDVTIAVKISGEGCICVPVLNSRHELDCPEAFRVQVS